VIDQVDVGSLEGSIKRRFPTTALSELPRVPYALEWHVPADQLAAEEVRRTLARRAIWAAPAREAAVVGQERDVARVLRRVALPTVTRAAAVDPVLAGTTRRR
jgi:hypothetical protein